MIFDTHAHLNFFEFNLDREEIIKKCLNAGIGMINVGTNFKSSEKAIEIASSFDNVYASVGLHPLNISSEHLKDKGYSGETEGVLEKDFDLEKYRLLAKNKKVVAIGEMGLDYWYKPKGTAKKELFKEEQKKILIKQLDLAEELNLPVIIHCRSAFDDLYEIISKRKIKGVLHCFTGSVDEMKRFTDLGLYIGINGIIFKMDLKEVINKVSLEKVLIETDCPYLSPPQFEERNNPIALELILKEIANNREESIEEIKTKTSKNAVDLFGLN
jgi:TatD DNase family protein